MSRCLFDLDSDPKVGESIQFHSQIKHSLPANHVNVKRAWLPLQNPRISNIK